MQTEESVPPRKIKFRSISTTTEPLLGLSNRVEDISSVRQRSKSEQKYKRVDGLENEGERKQESFMSSHSLKTSQ